MEKLTLQVKSAYDRCFDDFSVHCTQKKDIYDYQVCFWWYLHLKIKVFYGNLGFWLLKDGATYSADENAHDLDIWSCLVWSQGHHKERPLLPCKIQWCNWSFSNQQTVDEKCFDWFNFYFIFYKVSICYS